MTQVTPSPILEEKFSFNALSKKINKLWRIAGTGFGFASLGLGGLFLCVAVFPFAILTTRDSFKRRTRIRLIIGYTFAFYLRVLKYLGVLDLQISDISSIHRLKG